MMDYRSPSRGLVLVVAVVAALHDGGPGQKPTHKQQFWRRPSPSAFLSHVTCYDPTCGRPRSPRNTTATPTGTVAVVPCSKAGPTPTLLWIMVVTTTERRPSPWTTTGTPPRERLHMGTVRGRGWEKTWKGQRDFRSHAFFARLFFSSLSLSLSLHVTLRDTFSSRGARASVTVRSGWVEQHRNMVHEHHVPHDPTWQKYRSNIHPIYCHYTSLRVLSSLSLGRTRSLCLRCLSPYLSLFPLQVDGVQQQQQQQQQQR